VSRCQGAEVSRCRGAAPFAPSHLDTFAPSHVGTTATRASNIRHLCRDPNRAISISGSRSPQRRSGGPDSGEAESGKPSGRGFFAIYPGQWAMGNGPWRWTIACCPIPIARSSRCQGGVASIAPFHHQHAARLPGARSEQPVTPHGSRYPGSPSRGSRVREPASERLLVAGQRESPARRSTGAHR